MEAEKVIDRIARQYGYDNLSAEQLRMSTVEKRDDPLKAFSVICRHELQDLQRGTRRGSFIPPLSKRFREATGTAKKVGSEPTPQRSDTAREKIKV
jgi:hypothetical protein